MGIYILCKHTTIVDVGNKVTVLYCAGGKIATHATAIDRPFAHL